MRVGLSSGLWQRRSVLVCVGLTLFFLLLSTRIVGISDGDDSWYQAKGATLRASDFVTQHYWSPLYQLWFRAFSLVWHNPVWCYFACWVALVLLFLLTPLALKMRYAWLYTVLFVVYPFPTFSPYSGMFGGMLAVVALCLLLRRERTYSEVLAASCATSFVISGCRSEFDTAVLLSAVATLVAVGWEWRSLPGVPGGSRRVRPLAARALLVMALAGATVYVLTHAQGQRSGMAFAQHVNRRAVMSGKIPERGFPGSNYAELLFGVDVQHNAGNGTAGIGDFLRGNPKLFFKHVLFNIADPRTVLIFLLMLFAILYPWYLKESRALRPASLFLIVFLIPAFMDLCLIFPRDHYVMLLVPCVTLFALQAIQSKRLLQPPLWVLFAGMAAMVYINFVVPRLTRHDVDQDRVYLNRIECVRTVDATIPASNAVVFDDQGIRDVYLVHPRTHVDDTTLLTWAEFKAWAPRTHPAWITATANVQDWYHVTPAELDAFLQGDLGYAPHQCSDMAYMTLYVPKTP